MKKVLFSFLLFWGLSLQASSVAASPSEKEIESLANNLGWTTEDLEEYLSFKGLKISDFDNIRVLKKQLGTPITPANLDKLLVQNSMTQEELDILLAGFHESVDDFWFLEDLEVAIDFYKNHEDKMLQLEKFLENIGFDDTEKQQFYGHLNKLDPAFLAAKVEDWKVKLSIFQAMDQEGGISKEGNHALTDFWKDFFTATALKPVIISIDDNGKRNELSLNDLKHKQMDTTVAIELYDHDQFLIGDAIVTSDMVSSVDAIDKVVELTEVTEGLANLYAAQLPNTASSLPIMLCIGYMLVLLGLFVTFRKVPYEN
ncbi:processed acidic surface protein [Bacillus sp. PK3-056]|uniref:processed acidic surface protein n=1 Tax=Niallia circulans TaxID=1397 RepID=UPI000F45AA31|nr:processed acidic surface protein [Niallia circulans]AYV70797.1 processed acidic surface protein [Niallia circulans]